MESDGPYCLDTSFLINGWNKHYRIDVFPDVWIRVATLVENGNALIGIEVWYEIERKDDALKQWVEQYKGRIVEPTVEQTERMRILMKQFPQFAAESNRKNAADPWVITLAQCTNGIVVSDEERKSTRPTIPPKIPNVCDRLGIKCLKPIDFLKVIR